MLIIVTLPMVLKNINFMQFPFHTFIRCHYYQQIIIVIKYFDISMLILYLNCRMKMFLSLLYAFIASEVHKPFNILYLAMLQRFCSQCQFVLHIFGSIPNHPRIIYYNILCSIVCTRKFNVSSRRLNQTKLHNISLVSP